MASVMEASLSAEKFIENSSVLVYIEDAVSQLLESKDDNPKVNTTKFLSNYFSSVKAGTHILLREYNFIKATLYNRSSFVKAFWKCYANIGRKGDSLSAKEYHSLISLLCPDLPFSLILKTSRIVLMNNSPDGLMSFADFIYAFQFQLCYDEYLAKCATVYDTLAKCLPTSHTDTVIVPTSEQQIPGDGADSGKIKAADGGDGVDTKQFGHALTTITEQLQTSFSCPPVNLIRSCLLGCERISFYAFLLNMSKSEALNEHIGKLPRRAHLFAISDQELALLMRQERAINEAWTEDSRSTIATTSDLSIPNPSTVIRPVSTAAKTNTTSKTSASSRTIINDSDRQFSSPIKTPTSDNSRTVSNVTVRHVASVKNSKSKKVAKDPILLLSDDSDYYLDSGDASDSHRS